MIQVELTGHVFDVEFTQTNDFGQKRGYDSILIDSTNQSRVYCVAVKDGVRYTTIAKKMQFDDSGNVFLKFGKTIVVIGIYKEVA